MGVPRNPGPPHKEPGPPLGGIPRFGGLQREGPGFRGSRERVPALGGVPKTPCPHQALSRALVNVGGKLTHARDVRDFFVDLVEKVRGDPKNGNPKKFLGLLE